MESVELTKLIEEILENKKGREIEIINIEGKTILADYFVIVTGTSTPNVRESGHRAVQGLPRQIPSARRS